MSTKSAASSNEQKTTHQFGAEVDKILKLMIHSLYQHEDIFLRELISNASDACDKLRYESVINPSLARKDSTLHIHIKADEKARTLSISDNGIGMNEEDLIQNLGTIASSGTQRFSEKLSGDSKKDIQLIGQFGVGFYSAFMVSDEITVLSRKAGEKDTWKWQSTGNGSYTVEKSDTALKEQGTTIILNLREDKEEFADKHRITHIVRTYSDHISFPVELETNDGKTETINKAAALWTRAKSDITDEQYKEFYHHVAHAADEPWMILHNKAEGTIEYTNLLYIPTRPPFDLYHPERKTRVRLYVKRVFITDEGVDLIPSYLRFLRGVVDSEDLPLNISRETLQHNAIVKRIKNSIVKRVLSELKKKTENEAEAFSEFWKQFGAVLKEGLCEPIDVNKEQLLEVCQFDSSSEEKPTTLAGYISRMKENQQHIFYLLGDTVESLRHSPQLEGFQKRGIEVLLLSDSVDDFWVNVVSEYQGKELRSVTRVGIDLDSIKKIDDIDSTDSKKKKTKTTKKDQKQKESILSFFKEALGSRVQDVVFTDKLTNTPACLAASAMGMDIRIERFMLEQKQLKHAAAKILEINPDHRLVSYIGEHTNDPQAKELVELLFDQACILEGEPVSDPSAFIQRLNQFVSEKL
jgi:molecular chaperone HtpG